MVTATPIADSTTPRVALVAGPFQSVTYSPITAANRPRAVTFSAAWARPVILAAKSRGMPNAQSVSPGTAARTAPPTPATLSAMARLSQNWCPLAA